MPLDANPPLFQGLHPRVPVELPRVSFGVRKDELEMIRVRLKPENLPILGLHPWHATKQDGFISAKPAFNPSVLGSSLRCLTSRSSGHQRSLSVETNLDTQAADLAAALASALEAHCRCRSRQSGHAAEALTRRR
jgi:hypothetical protein